MKDRDVNLSPPRPLSFDIDTGILLVRCRLEVIHQKFCPSLSASTCECESSTWPCVCKAAVMIMESRGERSIRSTTELQAHQTNRHGLAFLIVCVCVYVDTAVQSCGCVVGLATWCSLQWVPVWRTIMTCQKCRPLKTGIIHRGYLTK